MGKKYLNTKGGSLEQSILEVWKQAAKVQETNKNDKMDDDGPDTTNKKLDAVQPKALKKKFKDRKDTDIDNDGDTDSTDKYLHKRRKAISKNIDEAELDEKPTEAVRQVDEYITKEGIRRKVKGGDGRRVESKKEDVDLQKNAEEYTQNAHFKIQSMADALRKVWSVEEDWRKKGPAAYDKKKEVHVPGHEEDDDDEKEKNDKKVKTETGKKAAKVEIDPEITEKK